MCFVLLWTQRHLKMVLVWGFMGWTNDQTDAVQFDNGREKPRDAPTRTQQRLGWDGVVRQVFLDVMPALSLYRWVGAKLTWNWAGEAGQVEHSMGGDQGAEAWNLEEPPRFTFLGVYCVSNEGHGGWRQGLESREAWGSCMVLCFILSAVGRIRRRGSHDHHHIWDPGRAWMRKGGGDFSMDHIDREAASTWNVGDRERSGMEILKVHRECNSWRQNRRKANM